MKKLLIETNPSFVVLKLDDNSFIFYNSIRHIGCRLNAVEIRLLNLMYKFNDVDYILSNPHCSRPSAHPCNYV